MAEINLEVGTGFFASTMVEAEEQSEAEAAVEIATRHANMWVEVTAWPSYWLTKFMSRIYDLESSGDKQPWSVRRAYDEIKAEKERHPRPEPNLAPDPE